MGKRTDKSLKFYLKLIRHPGTPESVGRGVAAGFFSAFITPIGQMPLALLLALPLRGAKGSALLATWITNPFNMPVIYSIQCYLGSFILGDLLSYTAVRQLVSDAIASPGFKTAGALSGKLVASFFAGGAVLGTLASIIGYFCTTVLVRRYRKRRAKRRELKISKQKKEDYRLCD